MSQVRIKLKVFGNALIWETVFTWLYFHSVEMIYPAILKPNLSHVSPGMSSVMGLHNAPTEPMRMSGSAQKRLKF